MNWNNQRERCGDISIDWNFYNPALVSLKNPRTYYLLDATFFSRTDDVIVYRAQQRNLHLLSVNSESTEECIRIKPTFITLSWTTYSTMSISSCADYSTLHDKSTKDRLWEGSFQSGSINLSNAIQLPGGSNGAIDSDIKIIKIRTRDNITLGAFTKYGQTISNQQIL